MWRLPNIARWNRYGVVQRERKLSGATIAQTLVLGWLHRPDATLEQLAQVAAAGGKPLHRASSGFSVVRYDPRMSLVIVSRTRWNQRRHPAM